MQEKMKKSSRRVLRVNTLRKSAVPRTRDAKICEKKDKKFSQSCAEFNAE